MNKIKIFILVFFCLLLPLLSEAGNPNTDLDGETILPPPKITLDHVLLNFNYLPPPGGGSCAIGKLEYTNTTKDLTFCKQIKGINTKLALSLWDINYSNSAYQTVFPLSPYDNALFGIGTSTPEFNLTIMNNPSDDYPIGNKTDTDYGILAEEPPFSSPSALPDIADDTSDPNAFFVWYPKKAALRAGAIITPLPAADPFDDVNIGQFSVAFGLDNIASGETIKGGNDDHTVVLGGKHHVVKSDFSSIGGGESNKIERLSDTNLSDFSFIGGGRNNLVNNQYSVIVGGQINSTVSHGSVIVGGFNNDITTASGEAKQCVILGGNANKINSAAGAGDQDFCNILGGNTNSIFGQISTVSGNLNIIYRNSNWTVIGGGDSNEIGSPSDVNYYMHSVILGGRANRINESGSTIAGGGSITGKNEIYSLRSTILGGQKNIIAAPGSGRSSNNFILGGENNIVNGYNNVTLAGSNTAASNYHLFVWNTNPTSTQTNITASMAFLALVSSAGFNTAAPDPNATLTVNGNIIADLTDITGGNAVKYDSDLSAGNLTSGIIGKDIAEFFETDEKVEAGDIMVVNLKNSKLKKSRKVYSKEVVGIVSKHPGILFEGHELKIAPAETTYKGKVPLALAGRVLCKVSAENGPIKKGDMLTSASITGHAMKASDQNKSFGAVFAMALENFPKDNFKKKTGMIEVLIKAY